MDWEQILGRAGIPDPPGRLETCEQIERLREEKKIGDRAAEQHAAKVREEKLATSAHKSARRRGRKR
jgi:hypothetical protein